MSRTRKPMGSELRAAREQREMADPKREASFREASFLRNLNSAREDLEWIEVHQAWIALGHDSFAGWWLDRVQPVMDALAVRPTPELARRVMDRVSEEEKALPPAQRRTKAELAALVGTSEWTARGRQDQRERRTAAVTDLENPPTDPVAEFPAVLDAVDTLLANRNAPATMPEEDHPGRSDLGDEDGASTPSDAQPLSGDVSNGADSDETRSEASALPPASDLVAGQQQERAGVSVPAAAPEHSGGSGEQGQAAASVPAPEELDEEEPAPVDPIAALEALADMYDAIDSDVLGPLLTTEELTRIGVALGRVAEVVDLLTLWNERTHP